MQKYTSARTSINAKKLPAISKKVDWSRFAGMKVLDYGGGKYDNFKEWLKVNHDVTLEIYDTFNRTMSHNHNVLKQEYALVICSNVLNVIDNDMVVQDVADFIESKQLPYYITVYTGDGKSIGKPTLKDCYQRNEPLKQYLRFFKTGKLVKGTITNK